MFLRRLAIAFPQSRRFFSSSTNHDLSSAIMELNKEMESVFGEPPSNQLSNSITNNDTSQEPPRQTPLGQAGKNPTHPTRLTHVGPLGEAQMVDVSLKATTNRTAVASCKVLLGERVFELVSANQIAKGDVLAVARIAGISGAKQTSALIPLCHNVALSHVSVDLRLNVADRSVDVVGEASSTGMTGVEMEALTAVSVAALTVYDMCKAASKGIRISDVRLDRKTGGKSGDWCRED